jgi:hypothetical protein
MPAAQSDCPALQPSDSAWLLSVVGALLVPITLAALLPGGANAADMTAASGNVDSGVTGSALVQCRGALGQWQGGAQ